MVASAGYIWNPVIAGHGAGYKAAAAADVPELLNIDIGGTFTYARIAGKSQHRLP